MVKIGDGEHSKSLSQRKRFRSITSLYYHTCRIILGPAAAQTSCLSYKILSYKPLNTVAMMCKLCQILRYVDGVVSTGYLLWRI